MPKAEALLRSRDNPRVRRWAKLARDARLRRRERRALIEGPHLLAALLEAGLRPAALLASESGLKRAEISALIRRSGLAPIVLADSLFRATVDAETPPGIAAEIEIPRQTAAKPGTRVFLEGVQDAGNVGAVLRSAAAFGAGAVVLDRACADPWSPKVLRAGMGGHFALQLVQAESLADEIGRFDGRLLCTVSRGGKPLKEADLRGRIGWLFGSEGAGVSAPLQKLATQKITIPMAKGAESLNVAAAAAVCLYESFTGQA